MSLVGYFLNCLGNFIVDFVNSKYNKNILINKAEVKQIKLFNNQEFGILVSRSQNISNNNTNSNLIDKSSFSQVIIKSKSLVIASGGKQDELNPYYSKILDIKGSNNVFRSDSLLKEEGYEKLLKSILESYLHNFQTDSNENKFSSIVPKKKKIVIIGGSHSGFSCAWILLNDPSTYKNIKIGSDYKSKFNPNCTECLKYIIKYKFLLKKSLDENKKILEEEKNFIEESKPTDYFNINENGYLNTDQNLECELLEKEFIEKEIDSYNCEEELNKLKPCNCFGAVKSHLWEYKSLQDLESIDLSPFKRFLESGELKHSDLDNNLNEHNILDNKDQSTFKNEDNLSYKVIKQSLEENKKIISNFISYLKENLIEVQILYRDHIRVYYPSEQDASEDNYTVYNKKEAINKQGKIYPFIGIRGDAKELYRKVIRCEEKRITLIKTSSNEEQKKYIQESDYVVWACGYNSNNLKIVDSKNNPIDFLTEDGGMVEVSKQLNILNKNKEPIKNLFGIGQGFSTKAPEIINGKKARADSIHLYNTHISQRLYNSLQGLFSKNNIDFHHKNSYGNSSNVHNHNVITTLNTGFSNNANNNMNINLRIKFDKNATICSKTNDYENLCNQENNVNLRKNSVGIIKEESNNCYKQTGLDYHNDNLKDTNQISQNRIQKIAFNLLNNNNNINYFNNQEISSTIKTNLNVIRIPKLSKLKNQRTNNYQNSEIVYNKATTINKNKTINHNIHSNIKVDNHHQYLKKSKCIKEKNPGVIGENMCSNLDNIVDFNENLKKTIQDSKLENNICESNYNRSLEMIDQEEKDKNSFANLINKRFIINKGQFKNKNISKRKPLSNLQQECLNFDGQKSVNNHNFDFNGNKLFTQGGNFSKKQRNYLIVEKEKVKKASNEKYNIDRKTTENYNKNNSEFNYGITDNLNKKIKIEMEKINNDEILKNYNESAYSNSFKINSNLNLPGFNSLNEMNKQNNIYPKPRKESLSNNFAKNNNLEIKINEITIEKNNFDHTSFKNFTKTHIQVDGKDFFDTEEIIIKDQNLVNSELI